MRATTAKATGRRVRRTWTGQEKYEHVEAWRRSGWSRLEYCRRQGLCYGTFGRWVKCEGPESAGRFALIEVEERCSVPNAPLELIAPNGWRVKVSMTLAEVMEVMGRC